MSNRYDDTDFLDKHKLFIEQTPSGLKPLMQMVRENRIRCIKVNYATMDGKYGDRNSMAPGPEKLQLDYIEMTFFPFQEMERFFDAIYIDNRTMKSLPKDFEAIAPNGHLWHIESAPYYIGSRYQGNSQGRFDFMCRVRFPKYDQAFVMDHLQTFRDMNYIYSEVKIDI